MRTISLVLKCFTIFTCFLLTIQHRPGFLQSSDELILKDFSLNAILVLASRELYGEMTIPTPGMDLPIAFDTDNLIMMIDELKIYDSNKKMNLRVYLNDQHNAPTISNNYDGITLKLNLGMDFGIFNNNDKADSLLDLNVILRIKLQVSVDQDQMLGIEIIKIDATDIKIVKDEILKVNVDKLKKNTSSFLNIAINSMADSLQKIEILSPINQLLAKSFTKISVYDDPGDFEVKLE
jgi:hypothetical protein